MLSCIKQLVYWSCHKTPCKLPINSFLSICSLHSIRQITCYILWNKQGKSEGFDSWDRPSNLTQIGFESSIFQPVWPRNLMDDPKNNRAPLLYYIKFCASFQIHQWIQTGVTVRKRPIWVKIDIFLAAWPCNLTQDSGLRTGLFNIKLHNEILHQNYIAKQY